MTVPCVHAIQREGDARLSTRLEHEFAPARTDCVTIQATEVDSGISPPADKLQYHYASGWAADNRIRQLNHIRCWLKSGSLGILSKEN